MKKANYLPVLFVAVFLLLCACAQQQATQPETAPSSSSSVLSSKPSSAPTTRPTSAPTAPSTAPSTAPTQPTTAATQPATTPTSPAIMPTHGITITTTDWITDRQIVPFEDRFKEDVPFGYYPTRWIAPVTGKTYTDYGVFYLWGLSIGMENGMEREFVHNIPIDPSLSAGFSWLAGDGRWGYWLSDNELCKLDLLTGELITLTKRNTGDIRWDVRACGKDTVCIFQLDAEYHLRIYYRDLHSEAERTIYQGILPNIPVSENNLFFYAPTTTHGDVYWEMVNPAFYEAYLKGLDDPINSLHFYIPTQESHNIPMLVRYSCDFDTGVLTEDFGWYDTCWKTKDCKCDHFNYENTKADVPEVLDVDPVEIPNIRKPTGDDIWYFCDTVDVYMYSDYGYGQPYVSTDYPTFKAGDFNVISFEISAHFVYFVTTDGTIVQYSYADKTCETIYASENKLSELFWCSNYDDIDHLYFLDGDTIVCIDTIAGTYRPIIQTNLNEVIIVGRSYIYYPKALYFRVRQGMYYKEYRYDCNTNEIIEDVFVP